MNLNWTRKEEDKVAVPAVIFAYKAYCEFHNVATPAPKSKVCSVVNRLYKEPEMKGIKDIKQDKYVNFYVGVRFYLPDEGSEKEDQISLPPWMRFGFEKPTFLRFYVNTNVCHDGHRVIYTMIYDLDSKTFCMYVKDILLPLQKLGVNPFEALSDRLVNGMGIIARTLRLCEGSKKDYSEYLTTSSVPKYREISAFSEMACKSEVRHPRYFSKSCQGVLLLTAEIKSTTCQTCSKDLNQVAKKKGKKTHSSSVCPTEGRQESSDEEPDMQPFNREVIEDSGCEVEDPQMDDTVSVFFFQSTLV